MLYLTLFTQSIICKYRPVSIKLGQNIYVQQNLNLIMGPTGQEQLELFALELGKIAIFDFVLLSSIYKYKPISTKLGH